MQKIVQLAFKITNFIIRDHRRRSVEALDHSEYSRNALQVTKNALQDIGGDLRIVDFFDHDHRVYWAGANFNEVPAVRASMIGSRPSAPDSPAMTSRPLLAITCGSTPAAAQYSHKRGKT
jgi:hypothetical protein